MSFSGRWFLSLLLPKASIETFHNLPLWRPVGVAFNFRENYVKYDGSFPNALLALITRRSPARRVEDELTDGGGIRVQP